MNIKKDVYFWAFSDNHNEMLWFYHRSFEDLANAELECTILKERGYDSDIQWRDADKEPDAPLIL